MKWPDINFKNINMAKMCTFDLIRTNEDKDFSYKLVTV